jgi:hypothetical protein
MEHYFVEGLYLTPQGLKKVRKSGKTTLADVEPFARSFWANTPEEAIQLATEALEGGQWTETPRVSKNSEEQRMRALGALELPGFAQPKKKRKS